MKQSRLFSTTATNMIKKKSSDIFRSLPKVPTTQFLEPRELTRDILFSGYRPVTYPVKENPFFNIGTQRKGPAGETSAKKEYKNGAERENEKVEHNVMAGPRGTGGIVSGGVNGTWRYNPRIPTKLLPYNLWSSSTMAMEYYPEWLNVPKTIANKLKPFDMPIVSVKDKKQYNPTHRCAFNGVLEEHLPFAKEEENKQQLSDNNSLVLEGEGVHKIKHAYMNYRKKKQNGKFLDKKLSKQVDQFIKYLKEKEGS